MTVGSVRVKLLVILLLVLRFIGSLDEFSQGKLYLLIKKFNSPDDDGDKIFTFSSFLDHRETTKGKWELLVEWDGVENELSWEPLSHMKEADPISCAAYARENKL